MRRMNAFVAPSAIHDCHNLLRCATAAAGSARVIKPCARSVAPVVYPSSASGYIRRAPSLRWACRTNGADSANSCHGRSLRIVTCSATLTGSAAPTRKTLPKNFDAAGTEQRLYDWWEQNGMFQPKDTGKGEAFSMAMPPPNVTGRLHMGHAMFVTLQDIMTRFARMCDRPTLWLPGTDHAGIATQMVVEKMLEGQGRSRQEIGREAFTQEVWQWKEQYGGFISQQLRSLGASCDWSRERFTLDSHLSDAVLEAFVRLHDKGLIYRGNYLVNWAPKLQTAVSDLEVEYSEEAGHLYFFKYQVVGSEEYLPVATTRPETILGDTAVAVHPEDDRYKHLVGKQCMVPFTDRQISVIADEYVDREFGTGALKITPAHDPNDYEIGKRHGLDVINIMNNDGTLNASAGPYCDMDRSDVRSKLWADMEAAGMVLRKEDYTVRVPRSQRGGEIVEPLIREQWFVRMQPLAQPALQAVGSGDIKIVPDRFEKIYNRWLENIKDWCISRQLWWGHRIPVYYVFPSQEAADASETGRCDEYVVAKNTDDALVKAKSQHGTDVVLRQEQDVLDTWFSSGLWPFSTLGWPQTDPPPSDLARFYPTTILETGHDILFFWVARMVMMGIECTGQVPFSTIYLHGLVKDEQGRKMSKTLGNVVDPLDVIHKYGTDALRFTLATGTTAGQDLNLSMDRLVSSRNFTNKLWNAGKFILFNLEQLDDREWQELAGADFSSPDALADLPLAERWIVSALHQVVDKSTTAHERHDFGDAGRLLYDFLWGEFADWYIEAAKARLYGQDPQAALKTRQVLVYAFNALLKLSHPFMPFITEELWQAMPHQGEALIVAPWPSKDGAIDTAAVQQFEALQAVVRSIRNARAEYGVELGRKIPATICVAADSTRQALEEEADTLCLLAKVDRSGLSFASAVTTADAASDDKSGSITVVVQEGLEVLLPMAGLFDANKEQQRLQKQQAKLEKDLQGLQGRLKNPKFVQNAKPEVVREAQQAAAEGEQKLAQIQQKMQQMAHLL